MSDIEIVEGTEMVIYSTRRLKSLWKPIPVVCQRLSDGRLWLVAKAAKPRYDGYIKESMRFMPDGAVPDWAMTPEGAVHLRKEQIGWDKRRFLQELEEARSLYDDRIAYLNDQLAVAEQRPHEKMLEEVANSGVQGSQQVVKYMRSVIAAALDPASLMTTTEAFLVLDRQLEAMQ